LAHNPTLAQRKADAEAADSNVDTAIGAMLPSVSVQAQYGRSIDTIAPGVRENGFSVIGRLTIPFYQGGSEEAAVRQAKQQSSQAFLIFYDAERQVREDFANAWQGFLTSQKAADFAARQAAENENAYIGTTMESRVGSRSIIDIPNADQELLQSKITALSQRQNNIVAAYRVFRLWAI
jgi:outer membrane protein